MSNGKAEAEMLGTVVVGEISDSEHWVRELVFGVHLIRRYHGRWERRIACVFVLLETSDDPAFRQSYRWQSVKVTLDAKRRTCCLCERRSGPGSPEKSTMNWANR